MSELTWTNLTAEYADRCAALELKAFPSANPDELLSADDIRAYAETFPEGFFVVLDGDVVVGQGAGIFIDFDFDSPQHAVSDITGANGCGNHDPDGDWYYGTDIVVSPDYRRRGIGQGLYDRRKQVVIDHNKRGIIAGGYMRDFHKHKADMTADEYIDAVRAREIYDPTLTFQMDNGFELVCGLENYLEDEGTDNWAALIVWRNPNYRDPNYRDPNYRDPNGPEA